MVAWPVQLLFAFCTSWKVSEVIQQSTSTRLAFPRNQKQQCRNRPQKFTIDIPSINPPKKNDGRVLVLSPHVKACDFLGFVKFFFSETFHYNCPVARAKQLKKKLLRVSRRQSYPARPHRWLGRKIFFCPISGTEFDHFWNWFGKNKFPGALQLLKQTFAQKYRIVLASSPWVSENECSLARAWKFYAAACVLGFSL